MSEQQPRPRRRRNRNRNRNRPPVIEEGGEQTSAVDVDNDGDGDGGDGGGKTERRHGARVQDPEAQAKAARPNTILGMPRTIFIMMAGLLVVIIATTIAGQLVNNSDDIEGVDRFPDQGRRHLAEGEAFDAYNSFPPTSGPQAAVGATPGVYGPDADDEAFRETPAFAQLLPILEQGGIVIYFDPGRVPDADVLLLRDRFVGPARTGGLSLLTLVPLDDSLPAPIVATAWRHALVIDLLDESAQDLLSEFIAPSPVGLYERFVLSPAATATALEPGP